MSVELKNKLKQLNESLKQVYPSRSFDEANIRERLQEAGTFYQLNKLSGAEIRDWLQDGLLVGVDGSVNSTKGSQDRTLSVFQALAKGTQGEEKWAADVYTPLLEDEGGKDGSAAREARKRGAFLSRLEMKVTIEAIQDWAPRVVMADGSLLHYSIDDNEVWEQLARLAEMKDSLLVGVSEEIGSRTLVKELFPEYRAWTDRDLLYGVLKMGEAYEWEGWSRADGRNQAGNSMWKLVFRTSRSPQPIGLDGLSSQHGERLQLAKLVYSLTPEQGRGIPYWLDIVDRQVRVTDPLVETMVDQYIDPEIRYRLLSSKRSDRMI
ncbi:DNA double-strand break repair nuclease NurA [Thermoactinomyces mirandus]|uniref:DNA double-strand break repair nuclease NurA n=1 Tax=Thermoactinomyces mirandus TaxID=2756294 RepID=UPI0028A883CD|nr:DNA double-strand break repair nuclease NurA [Thermoactinomyces mirandus]